MLLNFRHVQNNRYNVITRAEPTLLHLKNLKESVLIKRSDKFTDQQLTHSLKSELWLKCDPARTTYLYSIVEHFERDLCDGPVEILKPQRLACTISETQLGGQAPEKIRHRSNGQAEPPPGESAQVATSGSSGETG